MCLSFTVWGWGRAVSCLITVTAELKWSVSAVGGGESGHCSFCLADYWGVGGAGVGRYYEEWWAGVGGSLRCKVLHLVPHWAVKRWRPNRWQNSLSRNSHRLNILTQGTPFKLCGQAWIRWLVPLVLFAVHMRAWMNIIDISLMNYLLSWTADIFFQDMLPKLGENFIREHSELNS